MSLDTIQLQICPHPVFIIGSPRSGTSILAWSLAHHNQLWTSRESHILDDLFGNDRFYEAFKRAKSLPGGTWLQEQDVERDEFLKYLGLGLNALFTSRSQGRRWIDNTPSYTLMVDVLADMFPGAVFLHILRDGRKVVHSMMNFANRLADAHIADYVRTKQLPPWATVDFREMCKAWCRFVEHAMDFCARNSTRCLTVVNEELTANPHKGFREICEFLSLPYNTEPAKYFRSAQINSSYQSNASFPTLREQDPLSGKAFIMASPNPVPAEVGPGTTTISWSTGDGLRGQVYVSINGGSEQLFIEGEESAADASWIDPGSTYEFRLYAGTDHRRLLDQVTLRQSHEIERSDSHSEPWKEWTPDQKMIFYEEAGRTLVKYGLATKDELESYLP